MISFDKNEYTENCINGKVTMSWRNNNTKSIVETVDKEFVLLVLDNINSRYDSDVNQRMQNKQSFFEHLIIMLYGLHCCICCRGSQPYDNPIADYKYHDPICKIKITELIKIIYDEHDYGEIENINIYDTLCFCINILQDLEKDSSSENIVIHMVHQHILGKNVFSNLNIKFNGFVVIWIHMFKHHKMYGLQLLDIFDDVFGLDPTIFINTISKLSCWKPLIYLLIKIEDIIDMSIKLLEKKSGKISVKHIDYILEHTNNWNTKNIDIFRKLLESKR